MDQTNHMATIRNLKLERGMTEKRYSKVIDENDIKD